MQPKQPNFILIQTDQQSAETLRLYGNPVAQTPALERLAQDGIVFEHAFCNYPACSPSRSSMMTGRYASTIRCHANHMLIPDDERDSLPEVLKRNGYRTALIGKNHAFPKARLSQAFDYIRQGGHGHLVDGYRDDLEVRAAHQWALDHCWNSPLGHGTNPADAQKCGTYLLGQTAVDYLDEATADATPFFLWLSFPDPHTPYQAPEPYASMYDPAEIPMPPEDRMEKKPERQCVAHMMDAMDRADEAMIRRVKAIHYGMIRFVDDMIGRVLDKLRELQLDSRTCILFTSDHGDSMGAHGLIQKHNLFYDSFTHVPLIAAWPGMFKPRRSQHLMELVDLMPTLLELAGIEAPVGLQGKSFAAYALADGEGYEPREYVIMESGEAGEPMRVADIGRRPEHPLDESCFVWCAWREAWLGKGKSIRTHEWKLNVYANGEGELYDLQRDPHELDNLYEDEHYAEVVSGLERRMLHWTMNQERQLPVNDTVKHQYLNR